jgi:hypothetical protein
MMKGLNMDSFTATGIAEGWIDCDSEDQYLQAWQMLVDTGLAWQLQSWFGRTAASLIESGAITAPAK